MSKVGSIAVFRCPTHKRVITLTTESADGTTGTRHVTGKCCVRQYEVEVARWRLTGDDRDSLVRSLEEMEPATPDPSAAEKGGG